MALFDSRLLTSRTSRSAVEASKTSQERLLGQEVNASDAIWMLDVPTLLPGVCVCVCECARMPKC